MARFYSDTATKMTYFNRLYKDTDVRFLLVSIMPDVKEICKTINIVTLLTNLLF